MVQRSSGNGFLAFVLVLLVAAAGIGYVMYNRGMIGSRPVDVELALPKGPALPDPVPMPEPQPAPPIAPRPG